jgi:hypothetical protein
MFIRYYTCLIGSVRVHTPTWRLWTSNDAQAPSQVKLCIDLGFLPPHTIISNITALSNTLPIPPCITLLYLTPHWCMKQLTFSKRIAKQIGFATHLLATPCVTPTTIHLSVLLNIYLHLPLLLLLASWKQTLYLNKCFRLHKASRGDSISTKTRLWKSWSTN